MQNENTFSTGPGTFTGPGGGGGIGSCIGFYL